MTLLDRPFQSPFINRRVDHSLLPGRLVTEISALARRATIVIIEVNK